MVLGLFAGCDASDDAPDPGSRETPAAETPAPAELPSSDDDAPREQEPEMSDAPASASVTIGWKCGLTFSPDGTALAFNAHGGVGCISVTANVAPRECADFQAACARGDFREALELQDRLMPLHDALFAEPSPGGAKYALSRLGRIANELRPPLVPVSAPTAASIESAMVHAGLMN